MLRSYPTDTVPAPAMSTALRATCIGNLHPRCQDRFSRRHTARSSPRLLNCSLMPRFAANLSFQFQDVPFLDRFAAAASAGYRAVEFMFPYEHPPGNRRGTPQSRQISKMFCSICRRGLGRRRSRHRLHPRTRRRIPQRRRHRNHVRPRTENPARARHGGPGPGRVNPRRLQGHLYRQSALRRRTASRRRYYPADRTHQHPRHSRLLPQHAAEAAEFCAAVGLRT